jgi:hypothetical protein
MIVERQRAADVSTVEVPKPGDVVLDSQAVH